MSDPEETDDPWSDIGHQKARETRQDDQSRIQSRQAEQEAARQPCGACGHVIWPLYSRCPRCEGDRNRRKVEALAEVIRALKKGVADPEQERQLVKQLYELDHPCPQEFLAAVAARKARER